QAEDGIRDFHVTGVQTCALPICLPYAHVFAAASISHGNGWTKGTDAISVTASHEALEMLGDPRANEFCFDGDRRLWAREVCDPEIGRASCRERVEIWVGGVGGNG